MKKTRNLFSTWLLIAVLAILAVGLGYNYFYQPFWKSSQDGQSEAVVPVPRQAATDSGSLQNNLVASLSAQEKIAQLLAVPVFSHPSSDQEFNKQSTSSSSVLSTASAEQTTATPRIAILDTETVDWLKTYKPGFVQLMGTKTNSGVVKPLTLNSAEATTQELNTLGSNLTWPFLTIVRHSTGDAQTLRGTGFTLLPTMKQLCTGESKYTTELAVSAAELGRLKINIVVGPVVDLQTSSGYQGDQICTDPGKVVPAAQKYIENFGSQGIMPVLAHFPGIGQAKHSPQKEWQTLSVTVDELKPFQQLLQTYPNIGVLTSSVAVAGKFREKPCTLSQECLATFNKEYPQALLIGDILPTGKVDLATNIKQRLLAGNHVVIIDSAVTWPELTDALEKLTADYQTDEVFREAVESSLQHVFVLRKVRN